MSENESKLVEGTEVRTYFVRGRNAMLARTDLGELLVDYYLHLNDQELRYGEVPDQKLKDALAAILLHSASRPWSESVAWTINLQDPLMNVFATADNRLGAVAGSVFTEGIAENETNLFYSDVVRGTEQPRRSVVTFSGADIFHAVEEYYQNSEQRPARYFQLDDEDFVLLTAQPECDLEWLEKLDLAAIKSLDSNETLSLLETRYYKWTCGCSVEKLVPMLGFAAKADLGEIFGEEESIQVTCPRCRSRYRVTREAVEMYLKK